MNYQLMIDLCLTRAQAFTMERDHQGFKDWWENLPETKQVDIIESYDLFDDWQWKPTKLLRGTKVWDNPEYYIEVVAPEAEDPEYLHLAVKHLIPNSRFPLIRLDMAIDRIAWQNGRSRILSHAKDTIELQVVAQYKVK